MSSQFELGKKNIPRIEVTTPLRMYPDCDGRAKIDRRRTRLPFQHPFRSERSLR